MYFVFVSFKRIVQNWSILCFGFCGEHLNNMKWQTDGLALQDEANRYNEMLAWNAFQPIQDIFVYGYMSDNNYIIWHQRNMERL